MSPFEIMPLTIGTKLGSQEITGLLGKATPFLPLRTVFRVLRVFLSFLCSL
jgi:hypothetical protein